VFWGLRKREKFLKQVISNEGFLEGFISRPILESASPMITPFAKKNEIGWVFNIKCVIDADRSSQRRTAGIAMLVLAAILTASWFLGIIYLAVNVIVFFLCALGSISQSARDNALQHVLAIALVLDKWRSENVSECEEWLGQASSLRPCYNAVKNAR
jgi:hypothetical protein